MWMLSESHLPRELKKTYMGTITSSLNVCSSDRVNDVECSANRDLIDQISN